MEGIKWTFNYLEFSTVSQGSTWALQNVFFGVCYSSGCMSTSSWNQKISPLSSLRAISVGWETLCYLSNCTEPSFFNFRMGIIIPFLQGLIKIRSDNMGEVLIFGIVPFFITRHSVKEDWYYHYDYNLILIYDINLLKLISILKFSIIYSEVKDSDFSVLFYILNLFCMFWLWQWVVYMVG